MAVAAGAAIEGFSNVSVRFDFPARNGLTKFGVADFPGIERFAADAEEVSKLLVGQSEKAHPIRAVGKLRSISTRTPNAARRAVRLAPAGLFRTGFRLGDVHQRTGNKRDFHWRFPAGNGLTKFGVAPNAERNAARKASGFAASPRVGSIAGPAPVSLTLTRGAGIEDGGDFGSAAATRCM